MNDKPNGYPDTDPQPLYVTLILNGLMECVVKIVWGLWRPGR